MHSLCNHDCSEVKMVSCETDL
eukprot:COSAG02_NODE_55939_length_288_cov_0.523810_1_plen_21_part_10